MPPGARRRKAARKKKEKETQNGKSSTNDNPQGSNDGNSQDERGSDGGGDVGSAASHEHDNPQDQFKERNEEVGDRGLPYTRPDAPEETSSAKGGAVTDGEDVLQAVGLKDDGGVRIERELNEDSASGNVTVGHAESAKRSYNGDNRSSSSSSSDEDSLVVERRPKEDAYASVSEEKSHKDVISSVNSSAPEVIQTTEDAPAGKTTSSVAEAAPFVDSVQHEVSVNLAESTRAESLVISNDAVRREFENGAEKLLPTGSKKAEDRASPSLKETAQVSSGVAESVPKENESQVLPSSSTLAPQVSNDAESIKEPEIPEYSEKQPLLAPAPPVTQKTSWFSCCGILDVFTGSGR